MVKTYPDNVKREIGYNLDKIQRGLEPHDWKPMNSIGKGVNEMRIHQENEYRLIYVVKLQESIYVLHSFIKKTEKTLKN
jgi:phage-related protein